MNGMENKTEYAVVSISIDQYFIVSREHNGDRERQAGTSYVDAETLLYDQSAASVGRLNRTLLSGQLDWTRW